MPKCPRCGSELIEIREPDSARELTSGNKIRGGSIERYYGSVDVFPLSGSSIGIICYKCSKPDCPYRRIKTIEKY